MNYLCRFIDPYGGTVWLTLWDASSGEEIHELAESLERASEGKLTNAYEYTEVKTWLVS